MAETQQAKLAELSAKAARIFEADMRPAGRIEWIYHLLVADPERGATQVQDLYRAWDGTARHDDLAALSVALTELDTSQLLRGKALVQARLIVAWHQADITGAASLHDHADRLLEAAKVFDDASLTGDVYCLVGDVAEASGDLAAAEQAYAQCLAIFQQLAGLDPASTSWQQDLAAARRRVADVERSQRPWAKISRRLRLRHRPTQLRGP
jgi:hypothetical protein